MLQQWSDNRNLLSQILAYAGLDESAIRAFSMATGITPDDHASVLSEVTVEKLNGEITSLTVRDEPLSLATQGKFRTAHRIVRALASNDAPVMQPQHSYHITNPPSLWFRLPPSP